MATRAPLAVSHAAATRPRHIATPLAASSLLRARGPCGSLLYNPQQPKHRLRFPVAAAAAKPETVGKPPRRAPPSPHTAYVAPPPRLACMGVLICGMIFTGSAAEAAAAPVDGLAKSLQGVEVVDLSGKAVPIVDLWKDRKAVVAFARHFGCVLCRKRADLLAAKQDAMEAAGVALVLIGPGTVEQAKAFYEQTKFKGAPTAAIIPSALAHTDSGRGGKPSTAHWQQQPLPPVAQVTAKLHPGYPPSSTPTVAELHLGHR
ncbi:hypothetical protein E2562_030077 [Oryza meyeriana var. granulata]|uniref:Uncharacterized protein n=1 Tax=Oryza meyeriana var. granulata TaxID=110450 RepID=A0A6G1CU07_9ORYZ|nr:hypothetical protein E2562_030077 [Oryza meyeriana var. granulata]